jgi:hypothetical protein
MWSSRVGILWRMAEPVDNSCCCIGLRHYDGSEVLGMQFAQF